MKNEKIENDIKILHYKLDNIKTLLMGNGKIGVAEMARRSFEFMQHYNKTKNGRLDWLFRSIITILISFVAIKVGLK